LAKPPSGLRLRLPRHRTRGVAELGARVSAQAESALVIVPRRSDEHFGRPFDRQGPEASPTSNMLDDRDQIRQTSHCPVPVVSSAGFLIPTSLATAPGRLPLNMLRLRV
jgi:hypothetical protein